MLNLLLTNLAEGLEGLMNRTPLFKGMPMRQYHDHFDFALHFFQQAASASLNLTKSKALPLGRRNTEVNPIGIPYVTEPKILVSDSMPRSRRRPGAHHLPFLRTSDSHCARHAYVT